LESRTTYCRICEAACGLVAEVENDRVIALRPDRQHVVSRGFACAKGTRFTELHHSPDRVDQPLVRRGEQLEPAGWDAALADAGTRLAEIRKRHGPHSVAVYIGNPSAFSFLLPLVGMGFVRALGTRNYFNAGSLDCNNKFVVSERMLGSIATHPVPDLDRARFALLIGTNPSVSQSSFVNAPRMIERLIEIERRGGSVVIVDPRRSESARLVGTHVPIVPDTDAALLLALLHVVFDERLERRDLIARHARGIDELRLAARPFSPERVSRMTRIPADTIRELGRRFALEDGAFCHVSTGVNQGRHGTIAYAAKIALELSTGNLDRAGGALLPRGALDLARLLRRFRLDREPAAKSRIGGLPPVTSALPSAILADEILTPGPDQVRALIVVAGNPLLSMPGGGRLAQALESLDTLVCVDLFVNDTAAHATHVFPATDFLERADFPLAQLQLQPVPYLQWTDAVVSPRGGRREEWRILFDLARAAGVAITGSRTAELALRGLLRAGGPAAVATALLGSTLGPRAIAKLRKHPHGLRVDRERPGDFLERRVLTPSRKVELYPPEIWALLGELRAELDAACAAGSGQREGTLKLFTKRERLGHNSWMHASSRLTTERHAAHLSPIDASRLGIDEGDRLRLTTATGSIELWARIDPDVSEGGVAVPHGYGHHERSGWSNAKQRGGANVNALAAAGPGAVDALSGMCRFVGVPVTVTRLGLPRAKPEKFLAESAGRLRDPASVR
jgi:anaerobic selenocysteine-containing dehydrogenase